MTYEVTPLQSKMDDYRAMEKSVNTSKDSLHVYDSLVHINCFIKYEQKYKRLKPGLHIVGRMVSMCLRPCPKEHITALQVSIAKISCERLLLSKTCVTM